MEYLETECTECDDLTDLNAGTLYSFSLDLLTKSLTLKVSIEMFWLRAKYDPSKMPMHNLEKENKHVEKEDDIILLEYYEVNFTGIKKLNMDFLHSLTYNLLDDIEVQKVKNEYIIEIYLGIESGFKIICERFKVTKILENEMNYYKAYEY